MAVAHDLKLDFRNFALRGDQRDTFRLHDQAVRMNGRVRPANYFSAADGIHRPPKRHLPPSCGNGRMHRPIDFHVGLDDRFQL